MAWEEYRIDEPMAKAVGPLYCGNHDDTKCTACRDGYRHVVAYIVDHGWTPGLSNAYFVVPDWALDAPVGAALYSDHTWEAKQ